MGKRVIDSTTLKSVIICQDCWFIRKFADSAEEILNRNGTERLKQIYTLEQEALERIIDQALQESFSDHWGVYEQLKREVRAFVGWDAVHSEPRSSHHYESLVTFIDWLFTYTELPDLRQPRREAA